MNILVIAVNIFSYLSLLKFNVRNLFLNFAPFCSFFVNLFLSRVDNRSISFLMKYLSICFVYVLFDANLILL